MLAIIPSIGNTHLLYSGYEVILINSWIELENQGIILGARVQ
ncbi:MAG: hypothetical protein ACXWTY_13375 [Methylobacter sp.]